MTYSTPTEPRSKVHYMAPLREGHGSSRSWRRRIRGNDYNFTAVLMPDGERRYFVSKFNGYCGGPQFACAWTAVRSWTIRPTKG